MSSSDNNITLKKTSFLAGSNAEFINEFYADYIADPSSLPESWRKFFDGLSDSQKLVYDDIKGPSWSPEKKLEKLKLSKDIKIEIMQSAGITISKSTADIGKTLFKKLNG